MGGKETARKEVRMGNEVEAVGCEENWDTAEQRGVRKRNCFFCKVMGKPLCKAKDRKYKESYSLFPCLPAMLTSFLPQGRNRVRIRKYHCSLLVGGLYEQWLIKKVTVCYHCEYLLGSSSRDEWQFHTI